MRRVIGVVVSGFTLAACSGPALDFLKSSPATTALRFESVPSGAEVKVSGQTCRTPCELKLEVAELSATFALKGYQPQTVAVHTESSPVLSPPRFVPNPVHADLLQAAASANNRVREKVAAEERQTTPTPTSADSSAPHGDSTLDPALRFTR